MPPLEYADHHQNIVYWEVAGTDSYGKVIVKAPVGLKARWEPSFNVVVGANGERVASEVIVHCRKDFVLGSIIWYGKITSLPSTENLYGLYEVLYKEETPDLKNRHLNRAAYLGRFRDSLPAVQE